MTRWIQGVMKDKEEYVIPVQYGLDMKHLSDIREFNDSISEALIVPAETVKCYMCNRADKTSKSDSRGTWPDHVVPITVWNRMKNKKIAHVQLSWEFAQGCIKAGCSVRGLKIRRRGPRRSIKDGALPEGGGNVREGTWPRCAEGLKEKKRKKENNEKREKRKNLMKWN